MTACLPGSVANELLKGGGDTRFHSLPVPERVPSGSEAADVEETWMVREQTEGTGPGARRPQEKATRE